jgi:hypothetical protein
LRPATRTIGENGAARKRDLAGSSQQKGTAADAVAIRNKSSQGSYYYADVFLGRGAGDAGYSLGVTTR